MVVLPTVGKATMCEFSGELVRSGSRWAVELEVLLWVT